MGKLRRDWLTALRWGMLMMFGCVLLTNPLPQQHRIAVIVLMICSSGLFAFEVYRARTHRDTKSATP